MSRKQYPTKIMFEACRMHATGNYKVKYICSKFKISKASLMRWMTKFDGTKESLGYQESEKLLVPIHPGQKTIEEELAELGVVT